MKHLTFVFAFAIGFFFAVPSWAEEAVLPTNDSKTTAQQQDPLTTEADRLLATINDLAERRKSLEKSIQKASGEDRLLLERQNWQRQLEKNAAIRGLVANIYRQEAKKRDVVALKKQVISELESGYVTVLKMIDQSTKLLVEMRKKRDAADASDLMKLEDQLRYEERRLQDIYRFTVEGVEVLRRFDVDVRDRRERIKAKLADRAETIAARVQIAREEKAASLERLDDDPDNAAHKSQLKTVNERLDSATDLLSGTIALMAKLDMERVQYQQLLIETTGRLTADVFDTKVTLGLFNRWWQQTRENIVERGPNWLVQLLFVVFILLFFRLLSRLTSRIVTRSIRSSRVKVSRLLQETIVFWSSKLVMLVGVLVALDQLGVQVGPLLAGLGIAGFVIGFALQDTLSNFAAGAMILFYRPFDEGDAIEAAGIVGKVSRMSMASTTILTFDNQTLIVPNKKIWGDVIRNITAQKIRRVDLVFGIAYSDSVEHAESVLWDIVNGHEKVLEEPEPIIKLNALGESSVDFIVRPWCLKDDYWDVYWDLTRTVKLRFDQEGISIPFPQTEMHIVGEGVSAGSTDNQRSSVG